MGVLSTTTIINGRFNAVYLRLGLFINFKLNIMKYTIILSDVNHDEIKTFDYETDFNLSVGDLIDFEFGTDADDKFFKVEERLLNIDGTITIWAYSN